MKKWIYLVLIAHGALVHADTLVVPTQYTSVDAPTAGGIFNHAESDYQEVFDAADFVNAPPGALLITGFSWRPDNGPGNGDEGFDLTLASVKIVISTTSQSSSSLSPVFSNNYGSDATIARQPAPLEISGTFPAKGPNPFSITFPFDAPFKYDPTKGNLLIEVDAVKSGLAGPPDLDYSNRTGHEGIGFARAGDLTQPNIYGPVAQFTFSPISVPEPSTSLLLLAGLAGIIVAKRK